MDDTVWFYKVKAEYLEIVKTMLVRYMETNDKVQLEKVKKLGESYQLIKKSMNM